MAAYTLTSTRRAAYAKVFDFRTQFVKAARQILAAGGITAYGPGEGIQQVGRTMTVVDFLRGAATGRQTPVALGDWRYAEYSQFTGTLVVSNTVPMEIIQKDAGGYLTEDHVRDLEELTSTEHALFMEHLEPFTSALLPYLDVQELVPIEPDERPQSDREVNVANMRWRVKFEIRKSAWPTVA
jgi:hypothetical protein